MAGSQQEFDFPGADADAQSSFGYRMARLREALAAIPAAAVGLSGLKWSQVKEMIMATRAYELAGRQPQLEDLVRTSRLSARQLAAARQSALALGLIHSARRYHGGRRSPDHVAVSEEVILARSKTRLQPVCNPSAARPQGHG